jgi:hypothetical protein
MAVEKMMYRKTGFGFGDIPLTGIGIRLSHKN